MTGTDVVKFETRKIADNIVGGHCFDRFAPMWIFNQLFLFGIGVFFWIDAAQGATNFSPITWGQWAWDQSAMFWALLNMTAAAVSLIGLVASNMRRLAIIGGCLHMFQHAGLASSAFLTGGDIAVGLYASGYFLPVHMLMTAQAISAWND